MNDGRSLELKFFILWAIWGLSCWRGFSGREEEEEEEGSHRKG